MLKKMKIAVLAAIVLMLISGVAFARGGHGGNGGNRGGYDGGRNYRQNYRHCDYRPVYRGNYRPCARPVYVYPSRGFYISTPIIVIGW